MPYYPDLSSLPKDVQKSLPLHARVIYMNAYNRAWEDNQAAEQHPDGSSPEENAGQIAWAAVMKVYEQETPTGKWKKKTSILAG